MFRKLLLGVASTAAFLVFAGPAGAAVIRDQLDLASASGSYSQNATNDDAYDAQTADDFTIPAGPAWRLTELDVIGFDDCGAQAWTTAGVTIFASAETLPGAEVSTVAGLVPIAQGDIGGQRFRYAVSLTALPALAAGTYWITVQPELPAPLDHCWDWGDTANASGSPAAYRNPGGALTPACSGLAWRIRSNPLCQGQSPRPDQAFLLQGDPVLPVKKKCKKKKHKRSAGAAKKKKCKKKKKKH
jgi:hypothetical protein